MRETKGAFMFWLFDVDTQNIFAFLYFKVMAQQTVVREELTAEQEMVLPGG